MHVTGFPNVGYTQLKEKDTKNLTQYKGYDTL